MSKHICPACGLPKIDDDGPAEWHMNDETTMGYPDSEAVRICDDCYQLFERCLFSQVNFE